VEDFLESETNIRRARSTFFQIQDSDVNHSGIVPVDCAFFVSALRKFKVSHHIS
jgi:hypothetical protein